MAEKILAAAETERENPDIFGDDRAVQTYTAKRIRYEMLLNELDASPLVAKTALSRHLKNDRNRLLSVYAN